MGLSFCEVTTIVASIFPGGAAVRALDILTFSTPTTALKLEIIPLFLCGWPLNPALPCRALPHTGPAAHLKLSIRENQQLVTSGPCALVRHPTYTGVILSGIGVPLVRLIGDGVPQLACARCAETVDMRQCSIHHSSGACPRDE